MKHSRRILFVSLLFLQSESCHPFFPVANRVDSLEIGMTENQVLSNLGSPDDLHGPIANVYNQSVIVWCYNAKNVGMKAQPPLWVYMVDRKYVKTTDPGNWPKDSTFIYFTRFPN